MVFSAGDHTCVDHYEQLFVVTTIVVFILHSRGYVFCVYTYIHIYIYFIKKVIKRNFKRDK